jgi:hypothetical protein
MARWATTRPVREEPGAWLRIPVTPLGCWMLALVVVKLWLVEFFPVVATFAPHDDLLFVRQAASILGGEWLGRYSESTLVKGPFYPLFVAGVNILGVPLQLAKHLLYVGACVVAVLALKPYLAGAWIALSFALLLFNPYTFAYTAALRFAIYPALTLLVVASAFGLLGRIESGRGRPWLWSTLLGLSLAAFWYTREEGIWILPSLALLLGSASVLAIRRHQRPLVATLALLAVPVVLWAAATAAIALINRNHYGMAMINELKAREFASAYGALLRIETGERRRFYPVTRKARKRAYEVSPSLRELEPYIEGERGRSWIEGGDDDFAFSLFLFVLRDAVEQAGYYRDAPAAMDFYQRIGRELHSACESGRSDCAARSIFSRLFPLVPPWGESHRRALVPTLAQTVARLASFAEHPVHDGVPLSAVYERPMGVWDLRTRVLYAHVARGRVAPATPQMMQMMPAFVRNRAEIKAMILARIHSVYRGLMPVLTAVSFVIFLASAAIGTRRRSVDPLALLAVAALVGIVSIASVLTLMQVFTHPAIWRPMQHGFPMVILFVVVTCAHAWRSLRPLGQRGS